MSFLILPEGDSMKERFAIRLKNVSKVYRLYGTQRAQLMDVLGLKRFGLGPQQPVREFAALQDISLAVPSGHRIGLVGRNGAGKTTLLKLVGKNFAPTSGSVEVNGTVQALFGVGLGFHPDYTGRENVKASLQYNGLSSKEYAEAIADIIDFCELGEFIDQPFRTYSTGMQARLMFAASTAIHPDILIVDEVLGAGDAYFIAKSKIRVEKMVGSGCTMLLVSHSMQQVLELCREAVWLDQGKIRMQGEAFLVVKAYEEYIHGPIRKISLPEPTLPNNSTSSDPAPREKKKNPARDAQKEESIRRPRVESEFILQEPRFLPHAERHTLTEVSNSEATTKRFQAPGGISRWDCEIGFKVCGFSIVTEKGVDNKLLSMRPAKFVIFLIAEVSGNFSCRYGVAIHDLKGQCVSRIFGPPDRFAIEAGKIRRVDVIFNPLQIGPGEYTIGISILGESNLEQLNSANRFDLLSRSFSMKVELPESLNAVSGNFFHSAEWNFRSI
jgi:lipopolysaccharide transport system ATP-binding protein